MRNRTILIALIAVLVVFVVSVKIFSPDKSETKVVAISGIEQCSDGIDESIVDTLGTTMYGYVKEANDYNQLPTKQTYGATVREGSCKHVGSHTTQSIDNNELTVETSSSIVDIPEAHQSWKITYDWVTSGHADETDLGTITPTCLGGSELLYGDFGCEKVLNILKYGTPDYDPILQYMPYHGEGFDLTYRPQAREVKVTLVIPSSQKGNQELIENDKAIIPYWFEKRGLDINSYSIVYEVTYE